MKKEKSITEVLIEELTAMMTTEVKDQLNLLFEVAMKRAQIAATREFEELGYAMWTSNSGNIIYKKERTLTVEGDLIPSLIITFDLNNRVYEIKEYPYIRNHIKVNAALHSAITAQMDALDW